ncbi:prepilin peptidase [Grimontia hollisae]|uniref:Primosomal replication protein N prime prime n=2 Tax=Grimontia hollisae TaxID=673 RepID=D0IBV9_GRIHO|nr:primosomal replication protein [Grimontia hollisae]AUW37792.1 prepilin peptidase [Grimontia hollisae]EEY71377.1 primosomal replication protein N prime prime [Grimontia hollisae CIP 101886]MDF2184171.1 primosomal replication protein [Grimontia hollisae]STO43444.1 Primosomal replication protein N'' [Grimontia hollisae]STO56945.1 Primosomal replication protein N'' [Grimontia hollisae]
MDLTSLKVQLQALANSAADIDRKRGESANPLFDERLFSCLARLLTPCVIEAKSVVDTIEREQANGRLTAMRAEYLCEKLLNQLGALQREIATQSLRQQEKAMAPKYGASISQLYQDLAQHQGWERRLSDMIRDAEARLDTCSSFIEQQQAQKQLLVLEKRLARCKEARQKIEKRISFRERKG